MKNSMNVRNIIPMAMGLYSRLLPKRAGATLERVFLTPGRLKLRPEELSVMRRAAALPLRFDCTRMMPVFQWGEEGAPVVALVHGWAGRAGQLAAFVDPLLARGFRVVAMEAPGHGAADGQRSSIVEFIHALRLIERQFGPLHGVVAHSMGGAASLMASARGLDASRLAIIGTPDRPAGYLPYIGQMLGFSPDAIAEAKARIEQKFGVPMADLDPVEDGRGLTADVLVIHDRHDRQVRFSSARRLADAIPGSRLMETERLGHVRILKDSRVIDAVTMFLGSTGRRPAALPEQVEKAVI